VLITQLDSKDLGVVETCEKIYNDLTATGVEVLLDDREARPGVKFKDADLIGIPLRVTVGARGLKEDVVEVKQRGGAEVRKVKKDEAAALVAETVENQLIALKNV